MTREEATDYFKRSYASGNTNDERQHNEAINIAIKALEQEPCDDCISRQAVDELSEALVHTTINKADFVCNFWERLQKLPPVTPKEKTGHWIDIFGGCECSECGCLEGGYSNYCPNCGAKMIESQESEG